MPFFISYPKELQNSIPHSNMLTLLLPFRIFLHTYVFSAFRLVHRYVFRFQKDDERSGHLENGRVGSKPFELPEEDSSEMDCANNGKTRNSVFSSVSKESISFLKLENSEFTWEGIELDESNIDPALAYTQSIALDVVSKGRNYGVLKSGDSAEDDFSVKARIVDPENSASNMFDSLPEAEVQVLWEDYSIPSDSESAGDSTNASPRINHDQVGSSSKEIKAEENKQLDFLSNLAQKEEESVDVPEKSTETTLQEKPSILNFDHRYELNYLPDHQDIVQQLEMELRNAKTGGLPTIFEEEPEAINEKFKHEELMREIRKVYKTYAEKMWKLDILNNQSMHATGLLQLKYPLNSISEQNSVLWLGNTRKLTADPRLESVGELQRDMELVYVGQVCLSWEILQWQLRKAIELQRHDSQGICQYNQVASEFQLFKVVLKRFMEEERFQGNRVENYVQNRCVFRSLLQVPPIKDDGGSAEAEGREWEDEDDFS
ncbi:uncharacterized protein LOC111019190 isoform X2 [Momordica charantia]|nr:uncharacterized protein LOC111019190 isoform X2 [Momordica charantia]